MIWRIMEIEEGVIRWGWFLQDLHNASDDTKAEFNSFWLFNQNIPSLKTS